MTEINNDLNFEEHKSFKNRHLAALRNAEQYLLIALKEQQENKSKNVFLPNIHAIAEAQFKCDAIIRRMRFSKR